MDSDREALVKKDVPQEFLESGLELLAELERSGAVTATSLTLPPDLPFDRYEALATMFGQLHRTSQWLIGDLINYGEKVYGETYAQAEKLTGLAPQTCANYSSVCSRIPRSRRRPKVNFSLHAEVASMKPDEQKKWLRLAEDKQWTRVQLRDQILPGRHEKYQSVAAENGSEVLPAENNHVCQCHACGRWHRSDVDVVQPQEVS